MLFNWNIDVKYFPFSDLILLKKVHTIVHFIHLDALILLCHISTVPAEACVLTSFYRGVSVCEDLHRRTGGHNTGAEG